MSESLVFRSFYTEQEGISLLEFLKEHGIEGSIVKHRPVNDKIYIGENYYSEYHVKIKAYEFTKANEVLDSYISRNLQIDTDYYLHSFSDDELWELIEKPDEWNNQDIIIAKKILQDRGHTVSDTDIAEKKLNRIKELEKPEKEDRLLIILGYFFAFFFGFFGIFFGLLLLKLTKTLPDGRRVLVYEKKTRNHGKYILIIGLILSILGFTKIFKDLV
jgi:hypothetical protein